MSEFNGFLYAINKGDENIVQILIEAGANVNIQNKDGWAPLFFAVDKGYENIVNILLSKGADVNIQNFNGSTPLFYAVDIGYENIVKKLLSKGADINIQDVNGYTPLFFAVENSEGNPNPNIAQILINKGANVNIEANDGNTPLTLAQSKGNDELIRILERRQMPQSGIPMAGSPNDPFSNPPPATSDEIGIEIVQPDSSSSHLHFIEAAPLGVRNTQTASTTQSTLTTEVVHDTEGGYPMPAPAAYPEKRPMSELEEHLLSGNTGGGKSKKRKYIRKKSKKRKSKRKKSKRKKTRLKRR